MLKHLQSMKKTGGKSFLKRKKAADSHEGEKAAFNKQIQPKFMVIK